MTPQTVITVEDPLNQLATLPCPAPKKPESVLQGVYTAQDREQSKAYLATIQAAQLLPDFYTWTFENGVRVKPSTGFHALDNALNGGLNPGLIVIGGLSSLGKTTFALQMADSIARQGEPVLIISLEMSKYELMAKSISRESAFMALDAAGQPGGFTTYQAMNPAPGTANMEKLAAFQGIVNRYSDTIAPNIYIAYGIETFQGIENTIKAIHCQTDKYPVVILDYLQILPPENPKLTDKQNTDIAIRETKKLAVKYNIPFIAISSINRTSYKECITMGAFKESGSIEYSSDVLLGLQLAGAGQPGFDVDAEKRKIPRNIELVVLKNRNGRAGDVIPLRFYPQYNLFLDGVEEDDIL